MGIFMQKPSTVQPCSQDFGPWVAKPPDERSESIAAGGSGGRCNPPIVVRGGAPKILNLDVLKHLESSILIPFFGHFITFTGMIL